MGDVEATLDVRSSQDVVRVRQAVRALAIRVGLTLVDQTKIVTAASELARNISITEAGAWSHWNE